MGKRILVRGIGKRMRFLLWSLSYGKVRHGKQGKKNAACLSRLGERHAAGKEGVIRIFESVMINEGKRIEYSLYNLIRIKILGEGDLGRGNEFGAVE